ncbi:MAG: GNAT family N-acetyltransferase [Planctomycetota bacterium]
MSLVLRTAEPEDAATIHRFIQGLAEYEKEPDAVEVTPAQLAEQLAQAKPPFECLLAERNGTAVGFALFFESYSTWRGRVGLYLEDLYVPPEHRGQGIGKALLRRLAQLTVERGGARLEWAVLDWNEPAIRFYESLGARPMDEWTTWRLTDDALRSLGAPDSDRSAPPSR